MLPKAQVFPYYCGGGTVNRTYGTHKTCIFTYLYQQYLVLFNILPPTPIQVVCTCWISVSIYSIAINSVYELRIHMAPRTIQIRDLF